MKAAIVHQLGQTPVFGDFVDPVPFPGENRVTVTAAALSQVVRSRASGAHYSSSGGFPLSSASMVQDGSMTDAAGDPAARTDPRRQAIRRDVLDLDDVLAKLAGKLRDTVGDQITLRMEKAARPPVIYADEALLDQILLAETHCSLVPSYTNPILKQPGG